MKKAVLTLIGVLSMLGISGNSRANDALATPAQKSTQGTEKLAVEWREQTACINGQYYDQRKIDSKALDRMKKWNPLTEMCPLDPGKAAQLAMQQMRVAFPIPPEMKLQYINLDRHPDHKEVWYYSVTFWEGDPDTEGSKQGSGASVSVYLDGTVPEFRKGELNPFFGKLK